MNTQNSFSRQILVALGVAMALLVISCDEDDSLGICLEAPCGEINSSANNITVMIMNPEDNITNVNLVVDDENTTLSLDGIDVENNKFSSCWQTIPDFSSESIVIIGYELDGEQIIGFASREFATTNQLVLQISGEAAILQDYEGCIDVI